MFERRKQSAGDSVSMGLSSRNAKAVARELERLSESATMFFGARNIMKGRVIFLEENFPSKNALCGERRQTMRDVFVIAVHMYFGAKEHGTKFFEGFNNGEKFFFDGGVIFLCLVELARVEGNGFIVLLDDRAELKVGGIGFDVKRLVVIGINQ